MSLWYSMSDYDKAMTDAISLVRAAVSLDAAYLAMYALLSEQGKKWVDLDATAPPAESPEAAEPPGEPR